MITLRYRMKCQLIGKVILMKNLLVNYKGLTIYILISKIKILIKEYNY